MAGSPHDENTYIVDPTSGAEMARLIDRGRLITQGMGGLLAERTDVSGIRRVLDLACGPGGWAIEMAFAHPEIEVIGVDISPVMIEYAQAQAKVRGLDNTLFRTMDILNPLDFPRNAFDLVNACFLSGFIFPAMWPSLLQECLRITHPGGTIRLMESDEWGITSSPAFEKMMSLCIQAFQLSKRTFLPEGRHIGITPMLAHMLREAGCINVRKKTHIIDYSAGSEAYHGFYKNWQVFFKLLQPFLIKWKVTTQEEIDQLYTRMLVEMYSDDFDATALFFTVWGEKPR